MTDRYDEEEGDERLDEFLCEYVDGTMDSAVRASFEDYLSRDPELAAHVRRLSMARSLLCSAQRCAHAPRTLQHRLQIEIARDLMGSTHDPVVEGGLGRFATLTSLVGVAVLLGAVIGTSFVTRQALVPGLREISSRSEVGSAPSDAHGHASRMRPAQLGIAGFGLIGPSFTTPVLGSSRAITPMAGSDSIATRMLRRTSAVP